MANSLIDGNGRLNVRKYNEKIEQQREVFNAIDTTMVVLEQLPDYVDYISNLDTFGFSTNPLGFIFSILSELGVHEETLKEWIADALVHVLPSIEIGIKALLLSNLKSVISCNADPRIPLKLRKKASESVYTNILTDTENADNIRGIDINIDCIDPDGILDLSPFTNPGKQYYFGCTDESEFDSSIMKVVSKYDDGLNIETKNVVGDSNSRIARLARADDFNAFLWYVLHKGNRQNPSRAKINGSKFLIDGDEIPYDILSGNIGLLGTLEVKAPNGLESNIIAGNTFYDANNANYIAICIESKIDQNEQSETFNKVTGNTIVPISSDWFSCNWYVNKTNYYNNNLGIKKRSYRNYSEEKAICNIMYHNQYRYDNKEKAYSPHNFRLSILPKPYVLLPSIDETKSNNGEIDKVHVQWRPIKLLFDYDGKPNPKGKFSLISETYDLQPTLTKINNYGNGNGNYTYYTVKGISQNGLHLPCAILSVNTKTGSYKLEELPDSQLSMAAALVECYPGLTIYEFNYDFIMGMKLFDPKVICQKLFDNAANPKYDAYLEFTINKLKSRKHPFFGSRLKLLEIVKEVLGEDDDEITECFYTFSNEQYDEMLRKTEEIRYNQLPYNQGYNDGETIDFSEVTKILETFPENGSLDEQKSVITQALTKACLELDKRNNITIPSDRSTTNVKFLTNVLEQFVSAVVDSVLSPKVLMLLAFNKMLLEKESKSTYNVEELIRLFKNVIKPLIKEVRDLLVKKFLDYILQYLTPLATQLQSKILSEQFAAYTAIIKLLLSWFNKGVETASRLNSILESMISKFKGSDGDFSEIDLPSILDNFNYADIYANDDKDKKPINNNC